MAGLIAGPIAAAVLTLATGALAQTPADVTLSNVRIASGGVSYGAATLVVKGTMLSRAELERLLDPASPESVGDRVGRLQAAAIESPEVVSEVVANGTRQRTIYRNVVFSGLGGGKIASATAAGGTTATTQDGPATPATAEFGRFAIADVDVGLTVGLLSGRGTSATPLKPVYGTFTLDRLRIADPSGSTVVIDTLSGRDLRARPTAAGWSETVAALSDQKPDADPAEKRRGLDALADMLDAFSIGGMEASGLAFETKADGSSGRIDRIAFGQEGAGGGRLAITGLSGGGSGGQVRLASLRFEGLSLRPLVEVVRDQDKPGTPDLQAARRLAGLVGSIRLDGLEVEVKDSAAPYRLSLGSVDLAGSQPVDGVPTQGRMAVRGLAFAIPPNPRDDSLKQIASLGYGRVDASFSVETGWSEADKVLSVREFSLSGQEMGSVSLAATIGNVSRDVFSPDSAVAAVAAAGAAARTIDLKIENAGLFERIVAREARRQKRSPEDIRREYGTAAAIGIPALLGGSPQAKEIGQAIARFAAKPGRLSIRARAKQPGGYGAADFAASPNPASVLEALEVTATAE